MATNLPGHVRAQLPRYLAQRVRGGSASTRAFQRQVQELPYCEDLLGRLIEHRRLGTHASNQEAYERDLQEFIDKCARWLLSSKSRLRGFLELWNKSKSIEHVSALLRFVELEPLLADLWKTYHKDGTDTQWMDTALKCFIDLFVVNNDSSGTIDSAWSVVQDTDPKKWSLYADTGVKRRKMQTTPPPTPPPEATVVQAPPLVPHQQQQKGQQRQQQQQQQG